MAVSYIKRIKLPDNSEYDIVPAYIPSAVSAVTQDSGTNDTTVATTAFVQSAISGIAGGGAEIKVSSETPTMNDGGFWYQVLDTSNESNVDDNDGESGE